MTRLEKEKVRHQYPYIAEICDALAWEVLTDLRESSAMLDLFYGVYALGVEQELAAGIHRAVGTAWFSNLEKLDDFCYQHRRRFLQSAVEAAETGCWVDATGWGNKVPGRLSRLYQWFRQFCRNAVENLDYGEGCK